MAEAKKELLIAYGKMTPKERIHAFFTHSRLLMELYKAGEKYRRKNR